ncbi:Uncharacterised protein [Chlamydia abortus]|nr:Uncharacterised protein [Chlamydia abortus]
MLPYLGIRGDMKKVRINKLSIIPIIHHYYYFVTGAGISVTQF